MRMWSLGVTIAGGSMGGGMGGAGMGIMGMGNDVSTIGGGIDV